jgi:N-acetylmuramoyl-L-alanine amidase
VPRKLWLPLLLLLPLLGLLAIWPPLRGNTQDDPTLNVATIQQIRVGQQPQGAMRIVLEFSPLSSQSQQQYRWFTLPQPARVVIDFADVTFADSPNFMALPQGGLVKSMRAGRFRPHTVRMVLDLTKPSRVNLFSIPARENRGQRLVLDVLPVGKGQVATNIPPPEDVIDEGKAPVVNPVAVADEPAPVVPRQVVRANDDKKVIVTLDPGHGGVDPGGCGKVLKLCEKNIVLDVARQVREMLRKQGYEVVMTRDDDRFIPLAERVKIAQRAQSDMFVSFHADIHPTNTKVIGATTYVVSDRASDREAARLADKENDGDILAGIAIDRESPEVQNILISLVQRETRNNSSYLAQAILSEMDNVTEVRRQEPLFAGFRVLKAPDVPSVLIEMGYLSNPKEERQLADPSFRKRLAKRIADGIMDYVKAHVHY